MTLLEIFLCVALAVALVIILILVLNQSEEGFWGKVFSTLVKVLPFLYEKWPSLKRLWINNRLSRDLNRQIKSIADDSVEIDCQLIISEADAVGSFREGEKLIVMHNPGKNPSENYINAALSVANNCVPNADKILNSNLNECVILSLAKSLIESQNPDYLRAFASKHLLTTSENKLSKNPYHEDLKKIEDKKLFTRVYLPMLICFGNRFDVENSTPNLHESSEFLTKRIARLSELFMHNDIMPALIEKDDQNYEDGFEYFLNFNGLKVNIMFIRNETFFKTKDTRPYVRKSEELVKRGVERNFVIVCTNVSKKTLSEHNDRILFGKQVTADIKKHVKGFKLKGESIKPYFYAKQAYPIYCATFFRV